MKSTYKIEEKVWLYPGGSGSWYFITLDKKVSKEIKETHGKVHRGFGSIRVTCTTGDTTWKTSVFPSKEGMYLLPIKAKVRQKEGILNGDMITLQLVF